MVKVVATIEARMNSNRLPGKVLLPLNGLPSLQQMIKRISRSKKVHEVVVATTVNSEDDAIVELCHRLGCQVFRGSENDVLKRVLDAAQWAKATHIVELTGDCPLVDPQHIDNLIQLYFSGSYNYVSNRLNQGIPDGFDVQMFSVEDLAKVDKLTSDPIDRVHVSCYFYHNPSLFKLGSLTPNEDSVEYWPELAVTLDEKKDYELLNLIFNAFNEMGKENFSCSDVILFLKKNPHFLSINASVLRKRIEDG